MKRCGRCGENKPLEDFAWRRRAKGQRQAYCRACQALYNRDHYLSNKQTYIDRARKRRDVQRIERTRYLLAYFSEHPCADCGETDPLVLEFDHLGDKLFNIGEAMIDRRWEDILNEIEKCEVVCANCHRRRTHRRLGTMRVLLSGV